MCRAGAFWRVHDPVDPGVPEMYRHRRAGDATHVVDGIRASGGRAAAVIAYLCSEDAGLITGNVLSLR